MVVAGGDGRQRILRLVVLDEDFGWSFANETWSFSFTGLQIIVTPEASIIACRLSKPRDRCSGASTWGASSGSVALSAVSFTWPRS